MTRPDEGLVRRWAEAEARLYPVVLVRPELYERSIRLVRALADELAATASAAVLAERFEGAEDLARRIAGRLGIPTQDMDLGLVAGAAFAHRHREVLQEQHRDEALRRIREARERGDEWVVVYETGRPTAPPYRRLEMRLTDGAGIHAFVELDPETGGPIWGMESIQLDAQTGDWVTEAGELALRRTFSDAGSWADGILHAKRAGGSAS
ncbi:MAG TPA: hypothetical protein VII47_04030 [Actinomycetota bacterium]